MSKREIIKFYEYDLAADHGVELHVEHDDATVRGALRVGVKVDNRYLAAYIGPKDVAKLAKFLKARAK